MTLGAAFETGCQGNAGTVAIATTGEALTYGALLAHASSFAAGLVASGIEVGDRVAVWLPNGVDWLMAHWGITLAGCVVVPIGTRNRAAEAHHMLTQCKASALVMVDRFLNSDYSAMLGEIMARGAPSLRKVVVRRTAGRTLPKGAADWAAFVADDASIEALRGRRVAIRPDDVHLIQYTAGTTGHPKGAMLTHEGLLRVGTSHAGSWRLQSGDSVFIPNPLSHIMGTVMGVMMPLLAGATLVTMAAFRCDEALALIERRRCVAMAGAPAHYLALADCADLDRYDVSSLRLAMCGGAGMTPESIRHVMRRLRLRGWMNGLGMTEASGSVTRTSLEVPPEIAASTIGQPMPWLETRIVDVTSGAAAAGAPGELWIRGPGVTKGYYAQPEATAQAFTDDGWFKTGDLVRTRDDGALEFVGRLKEMFTVGGFNVYPVEVERALAEHPAVRDSCVVGVADARLGEVPFAYVRLRTPGAISEESIVEFCRERIANYKVPRHLALVEEFPITGAGKIDRQVLRDRAARDAAHLPRW